MSSFQVPAPPTASFEKQAAPASYKRAKRRVLLNEAFLERVYRANGWFAAVLAVTVGLVGHHFGASLSSALGSLTGLLFLKTQELFVARWLRSKTGKPGGEAKADAWRYLPTWLIVPGKYAVLIAAILLLRRAGLMNYLAFVGGCVAVQLIMLTMAMGRLLNRRSDDGKAATMLREVYVKPYVAPHQMKK